MINKRSYSTIVWICRAVLMLLGFRRIAQGQEEQHSTEAWWRKAPRAHLFSDAAPAPANLVALQHDSDSPHDSL